MGIRRIRNRRMVAKLDLMVLPEVRLHRATLDHLEHDSIEYLELLRYAQATAPDHLVPARNITHHGLSQITTPTCDAERFALSEISPQRPSIGESTTGCAPITKDDAVMVEGTHHATLSPTDTEVQKTKHGELAHEPTPRVAEGGTKILPKKRTRPGAEREKMITPTSTTSKVRMAVQGSTTSGHKLMGESIHLHHYVETGRWGAWVRVPCGSKCNRIFLGTHLSENLAARCQDRAILMYESVGINTNMELNFHREDYAEDEELRSILTLEEFRKLLQLESRPKYTKLEATPCLRKFLGDELALRRISKKEYERAKSKPLEQHFVQMLVEGRKLKKNSLEYVKLLQRLLSTTLVVPQAKCSPSFHELAPLPKWGTKGPSCRTPAARPVVLGHALSLGSTNC